jgi:hypothetical protein
MSLALSSLGQEVRGDLAFEGFKMSVIVNASRDKYRDVMVNVVIVYDNHFYWSV